MRTDVIRVKGNRLPYVTSELRKMIRQRDYLRGKANKTGSRILRQAYDQVKNAVSHTLYKLRKNYYTNKIKQHKDDLKIKYSSKPLDILVSLLT